MDLNKALGYAVILGWDELQKVGNPRSARVEYRSAAGTTVDYLSVWLVDAEGHEKMMCDYWTWTSAAHARGTCFTENFSSPPLGLALDFILMNQGQFTQPADACPEGLALIDPPTADESAEAASWMSGVRAVPANVCQPEAANVAAF